MPKSLYGGKIRKDIPEQNRCVAEGWMERSFDDRTKGGWPLRNGNPIV